MVYYSTRKKLPLSGRIIQDEGRQIDFMASNEWLRKFKIRHSISYHAICGELTAVNPITTNEWLNPLSFIIDF
jgi:hypothetical protein